MSRSLESDANNYQILESKPVPTISSCKELARAIKEFGGNIPFMVRILMKSTIYWTDPQLALVQNLLDSAEVDKQFGYKKQFLEDLFDFEESLYSRIKNEKVFFTQQKRRYTEIYEILRQNSFPYSAKQSDCLHRMIKALYVITGHPNSEADKEFVDSLEELVQLMKLDDHFSDESPHRFVVTSTIPYYLHKIVAQLDRLAKEEEGRPHPDFIHPDSKIDLASYLVVNLGILVETDKVLTPREHFHKGMMEIYTRFVDIFKKSGLELSSVQQAVIQKVEQRVRDLKESPFFVKHFGITEACWEFMSELENDKLVIAPEGENKSAITEISWDLIYLQPVATEHLAKFPTFGRGVENVVARLMERFLELYPLH